MSPVESKSWSNINRVRMFGKEREREREEGREGGREKIDHDEVIIMYYLIR